MSSDDEKEFEEKWGAVCPKCKLRKGTVLTTGKSEGGRNSVCECDNK